jgi:phenylacetate-CoA ligase
MHPAVVRHAIYPLLQAREGSRVGETLRELERSQWYSPEQLREIQWAKLRGLLAHAAASVPYYRALFRDLGVQPEDFRRLEDFSALPVLPKEVVRDRSRELIAEGAGPLIPRVTSGATGIPLRVYIDRGSRDWLLAAVRRGRRWWGLDVGDRYARLTTSSPPRRERLRKALLNERSFSCVELSDAAMERLYRRLQRFHPACLRGNPHTLARFAQFVATRSARERRLRPRVVYCSAETLYPHQRALLQQTFHCPVVDQYGSNENGLLAVECPAGRMHIAAENVFMESRPLNGGGAGMSELVVTDLNNRAMPLLRYALGDLGTPTAESCPCGRGLPLLTLKAGRTGDFVVLPGGRYLDHAILCAIFEDPSAGRVRQYRIIQETVDRFTVQLEAEPGEEVAGAIRRGFRSVLSSPVDVDVQFVAALPEDRSGKLRLFISRLEQPFLSPREVAPAGSA